MDIEISVIVPFLNEEKYIRKCILSLLNQDFPKTKYEVIFIDNGSTDRSAKIVADYPRVILLQEKIKNSYAARNKGLRIAKGKIIAFTDADCIVNKSWLNIIRHKFKDYPKADILLGQRRLAGKSIFLKIIEDYENYKVNYIVNQLSKSYIFGFTNNMAIRHLVILRNGMFSLESKISGDTRIVAEYLAKYPDKAALYCDKMSIIHQEVKSVGTWIVKVNQYGRENEKLKNLGTFSVLKMNHLLAISWKLVKYHNYSILRSILAFITLLLFFISYKLGEYEVKKI